MSIEEKFEKAVNVIRNLPKHGSYQPSHELQLRFYAFYKQATEGPNRQTRPNFWEVVKKAKWDAWNKLGNMPKEVAMNSYVEELRKIVETMAYTDNVESFVNSLGDFYENVPPEDLELLVGPVIQKIRSNPNSPLGSRDASPNRPLISSTPQYSIAGSIETSPASSYSASPPPTETDDEEDEHFLDAHQYEPDVGNKGAIKKIRPEKTATKRSVTRNVTPERSYLVRVGATGPVAEVEESVSESSELYQNQTLNTGMVNLEPDSSSKGAIKKTRAEKPTAKRNVKRNDTPEKTYLPRVGAGQDVDSDENEYSPVSETEHTLVSHVADTDMQKKGQDLPLHQCPGSKVGATGLNVDEYEDTVGRSSESNESIIISHRRRNIATVQKKVSFEEIPPHRSPARTSLKEPSKVTREVFEKAISNLTKEMELLQRRTAMLEVLQKEELEQLAAGTGDRVNIPHWWNLSLPTTAIVFLWPVLLLFMSRWVSSQRRQ